MADNITEFPEPLISGDVDLREFDYMPLYGKRLFTSETWINADPEEKVAALRLWWASWHEEPAGSLPDNDRMLAELAGYGVAIKAFQTIKTNAMRGWIKCADGRLYHPIVCEIAEESWAGKRKKREENERDRQRKAAKRTQGPAEKGETKRRRPSENKPLSGGQDAKNVIVSGGKIKMSDGHQENSDTASDGIPAENALKGREEKKKGREEDINIQYSTTTQPIQDTARAGPPTPGVAAKPSNADLARNASAAISEQAAELRDKLEARLSLGTPVTSAPIIDWLQKGATPELIDAVIDDVVAAKPPEFKATSVAYFGPAILRAIEQGHRPGPPRQEKFNPVEFIRNKAKEGTGR